MSRACTTSWALPDRPDETEPSDRLFGPRACCPIYAPSEHPAARTAFISTLMIDWLIAYWWVATSLARSGAVAGSVVYLGSQPRTFSLKTGIRTTLDAKRV